MQINELTTATVRSEIEAQPALEVGTQGWWKVYGASARSIQAGDYVLTKNDEFYVQDTFVAKNQACVGIVVDGERCTIGMLAPVTVVRQGTKSTLAI